MSKNNNFNGFSSKSFHEMFGLDPKKGAKIKNKRMFARQKAKNKKKEKFEEEVKKWEEDVQKPWSIVRKDD